MYAFKVFYIISYIKIFFHNFYEIFSKIFEKSGFFWKNELNLDKL